METSPENMREWQRSPDVQDAGRCPISEIRQGGCMVVAEKPVLQEKRSVP
jgi:hypothetical protein